VFFFFFLNLEPCNKWLTSKRVSARAVTIVTYVSAHSVVPAFKLGVIWKP